MMDALGNANLFPFCPKDNSIAAVPNACPTAIVRIGGLINCMVSAIANASVSKEKARPSGEFVPGEFIYIVMICSF